MMLSDREILSAVQEGRIKIIPFSRDNLGPCSVDLTLSSSFKIFRNEGLVDSKERESSESVEVVETAGRPFTINPGQFALAKTNERIAISKDLAATLEGRSSVARKGIVVHAAGLVNPGSGLRDPIPLVLEVFCQNTSPVKLHPGMRIVQIIFHQLTSETTRGYDEREDSRFVGQS